MSSTCVIWESDIFNVEFNAFPLEIECWIILCSSPAGRSYTIADEGFCSGWGSYKGNFPLALDVGSGLV